MAGRGRSTAMSAAKVELSAATTLTCSCFLWRCAQLDVAQRSCKGGRCHQRLATGCAHGKWSGATRRDTKEAMETVGYNSEEGEEADTENESNQWQWWVIFSNCMSRYETNVSRARLEKLHESHGSIPTFMFFVDLDFMKIGMCGNQFIEWIYIF